MLQLHKDLQESQLPERKEQLSQSIAYTEDKIDKLVYQLYDLNEDEIRIIENG